MPGLRPNGLLQQEKGFAPPVAKKNPNKTTQKTCIQLPYSPGKSGYRLATPAWPVGSSLPKFPPTHHSEAIETRVPGLPEDAVGWGTAHRHPRAREKLPIRVLFTRLIGKTARRLVLMAFYFFQFVRGLHCLLELLLEKSRYYNRKIFRSNRGERKRKGRNYRHSSFCTGQRS